MDNKILNKIYRCFLSPDINKPYHFLWNSEDSYKNWYNSKNHFLSIETLIFTKKEGNTKEDIYLKTTILEDTILEKHYKICTLTQKPFEEMISYKIEFLKVITNLDGKVTKKDITSPIYSSTQEIRIPVYIMYNGALPKGGDNTIPDYNNMGGYFICNKGIKKYMINKQDKSHTWLKFKKEKSNFYHGSFNSIVPSFEKTGRIPQFLTIDLDLNYGKTKFIIDSKKSFVQLDIIVLIKFLTNFSLEKIKNILYSNFNSEIRYYIDIIFENTKNILLENNEEFINNKKLIAKDNIDNDYLLKIIEEENNDKNRILNRLEEEYIRKEIPTYIKNNIKKEYLKEYNKYIRDKLNIQEYFNQAFNNFLPHLKNWKRLDKGLFLIGIVEDFLVAIFQESIYPKKDHFSTRRIATLGSIFESICKSSIDSLINEIKNQIDKIKNTSVSSENIIKDLKIMSKNQNAFNNVFNMQDKKNSQTIKPSTNINMHQDITVPNLSVFESQIKLTKNLDARDPDISTFSIMGPVDTPDHSDNVALIRRINIKTKISYMDVDTHKKLFDEICKFVKIENYEIDDYGCKINIVDETSYPLLSINQDNVKDFVSKLKEYKVNNKFISNQIDIEVVPVYYKCDIRKIFLPYKNKFRKININVANRIPYSPYFIVKDGKILFFEYRDQYKKEDFMSFSRFTAKYPVIEWIGPGQRTYSNICESIKEFYSLPDDIKKEIEYIDFPNFMNLSILENMLYDIGRIPGARGIFATAQQKQIIMGPSSDYNNKIEPGKFLIFPYQHPCVTNMVMKLSKIHSNGIGFHVNVAFMSKVSNIDDALIINRKLIDNNALTSISLNVVKGEVFSTQINVPDPYRTNNSYKKLNSFGIPDIGAVLVNGDALYKKVSPRFKDDKQYSFDNSESYNSIIPGRVERSLRMGTDFIKISYLTSSILFASLGMKMANRAAQKGTIGEIREDKDMPYCKNGEKPGIIMNSTSIIARRTISLLIESILSVYYGYKPYNKKGDKKKYIDYPAFTDIDLEELIDMIINDLTPLFPNSTKKEIKDIVYCNRIMYDPRTHTQYKTPIYFSPLLYCVLQQKTEEKINVRDKGILNKIDQPPAGKKKKGAVKFGEMEVDCLVTHGAAMCLQEISRGVQEVDEYSYICSRCGIFATMEKTIDYNIWKCINCNNLGYTPLIDKFRLTKAAKMYFQILNQRGIKVLIKDEVKFYYP